MSKSKFIVFSQFDAPKPPFGARELAFIPPAVVEAGTGAGDAEGEGDGDADGVEEEWTGSGAGMEMAMGSDELVCSLLTLAVDVTEDEADNEEDGKLSEVTVNATDVGEFSSKDPPETYDADGAKEGVCWSVSTDSEIIVSVALEGDGAADVAADADVDADVRLKEEDDIDDGVDDDDEESESDGLAMSNKEQQMIDTEQQQQQAIQNQWKKVSEKSRPVIN